MSKLIVDEVEYDMDSDQETLLRNAQAIVETDTDEYRLASYDEMYGTPGSPIRAPATVYSVFTTLIALTPSE